MNLEVMVEEPSAERALTILLPRIVGTGHGVAIRAFDNKRQPRITVPPVSWLSVMVSVAL
jgi:hypothetical protein